MNKREVWLNYRCRKCHNIISAHKIISTYSYMTDAMFASRLIAAGQGHNCPEGIAEGEQVALDCISTSEGPLPDAFDIIDNIKEEDLKEES